MEQLIQEAVVTAPRALLAETIDLVAVLVRDGTGRRLSELARVEGLDPATGAYRLVPHKQEGESSRSVPHGLATDRPCPLSDRQRAAGGEGVLVNVEPGG